MKPAQTIKEKIRHSLHLERALRLVWQSAPGWTAANFGLILIQGLLPLVSLYLMKLIVDAVTLGLTTPGKPEALQRVILLIVIATAVALFAACCRSLTDIVKEAQTQVVTDYVAGVIHRKSVAVDLEYYEDPRYYDTLHRAQQEGAYRPGSIMSSLMQLGQSGVSLVALAGLLLLFHWWIAAILFIATVPGVVLRLKYANRMYDWQRQHTQAQRRADDFHWMLTDGGFAKEIRLFGLGSLFMGWFRDLRQTLRVERLKISARLKLNEFPQFINVLKGDMTLIGPRPEAPDLAAAYPEAAKIIFSVRPGLAGPNQILGRNEEEFYPPDVDPVTFYIEHILPQKLPLDLAYILKNDG